MEYAQEEKVTDEMALAALKVMEDYEPDEAPLKYAAAVHLLKHFARQRLIHPMLETAFPHLPDGCPDVMYWGSWGMVNGKPAPLMPHACPFEGCTPIEILPTGSTAELVRLRALVAGVAEQGPRDNSIRVDWDMESKDVLGVLDAIYADYSSTFGMTPNEFMAKQMRRVQARLFDWWTTNRGAIREAIVAAADVPKLRASLIRACNASGAWCSDTVSNAFLAEVGAEVEAHIKSLHSNPPTSPTGEAGKDG